MKVHLQPWGNIAPTVLAMGDYSRVFATFIENFFKTCFEKYL